VEGGSLKDLIRKIGPIPEERALKIFSQVAGALSYAHEKGVIHRDIKPSNIMIGKDDEVKVMDFGIARMAESPGLTRTGTQMGTLIYMSPEQIRDSKHIDSKSDVYSLGVTLYEMLTGKSPYDETTESDFDIREKIVYKDLPDPSLSYPYISDPTLKLFRSLTQKDKESRPDTNRLLIPENEPITVLSDDISPPTSEPTLKESSDYIASPDIQKAKRNSAISWIIGVIIVAVVILLSLPRPGNESAVLDEASLVVVNALDDTIYASQQAEVSRISATDASQKSEQTLPSQPRRKITNSGMILIPGGTFTMGDTRGEGGSNELPTHSVTLNSFYMGTYEVTQAEYSQYMQPGSSWTSNYGHGDDYPAYYVSWYAIIKYCNLRSLAEGLTPCYTISGSTNPANWGSVPTSNNSTWNAAICNWNANGYRLPTEAEWEYAARGATNTPDYLYSGSDDINAVAWYDGNNSPYGSKPVGTKSPNGLGLYDMSGNLWEWCWDWYSSSYYSSSSQNNPTGPASGSGRVGRGGFWDYSADICRVASRDYSDPYISDYDIGFRLCRAVP
ncbi:MAG: bifunctional serine/threonine-protein kinase/formylglycine-generating enzyme family protein, partial [Bacteroidales bacterium]|nr:bifunctional serine/threonine-protein kinase/formylglycine-generating enzyme family protein [Bacteroidales bacterium]